VGTCSAHNEAVPPLVDPVLAPGSLAQSSQPILGGSGLLLRPWYPGDAIALVGAYSDPGIRQWHARSLTKEEAEQWIVTRARRWQEELGADWAVTMASRVIGRAGLKRIDLAEGLGEVAYWVLPGCRRGRVATNALRLVSDWAFDRLGLHRMELMHSTRNPASCRVAELAAYALEGTKRQETLHPDGWHDMHLHARLAGEPCPG
jgi:[ribosomal protein S5]-alanine N-acetyltransferase